MNARFTSFATYQDLVGYINCLLAGNSATFCYNKGDNGTGASGRVTAQIKTPMCALPKAELVKKWGSVKAAWGKKVKCTIGRKTFFCEVADIGPVGVCDLNPAALLAANLPEDQELNVQGEWEWAD